MAVATSELIRKINDMTYTQFVGYIYQWNVPPGSLSTVNEWSVFGHVDSHAEVLEVACTTGFSGRELSRITGCSVVGIDICDSSISSASQSKSFYSPASNLKYIIGDACTFNFGQKFSHVIIGASLGFFQDQNGMLARLSTFFRESGYILASPYYGNENIPQPLIDECKKIIGITPTMCSYDTVRSLYETFEVAYESRKNIEIETVDQMKKYTFDTISNCCKLRRIESEEVFNALYSRLYAIKNVSNELHKHQRYSVLVLRYLESVYPNRFIELF
jgi:SAM-dependent methyltransferase